ncbi:transcriptional regulator with XRE-family HTH domain [Lactobacillus colini]|uniref:Transcriptional regulator with XRE-family HTH domain n=1 Tax=Lactobacillus colini TaxID=1819254 RepID=A0ABS4MGY3_9LACO|nr:helix-turn-helix transcriptional regulator [Lactobacillus colini]MBP2058941.1 transcriptional regulator with XRE-family HTH domain [Lactobacillus colini]
MIQFERVKILAKQKKMTLKEVNDKAGIGTNSIYNWKTRKPGSDAVKAVAHVLGTSTDYLNGLTDNPIPRSEDEATDSIPLDQEMPYSYHGYNVPEKYLKIIRNLMEDDIKEGQAKQNEDK